MKVVDDQSSAMSWVTIAALIGLIAVIGIAYKNRDRFMPPTKTVAKVARGRVSEEVEAKFFEARDRIVGGKYDEASAILTSLDTDKVPQPTRNWITMQNGLTRLLAGKLPEAQTEFSKVEKRGSYTTDAREETLARFFVETAGRAASAEPVKHDLAKEYNPDTTEAFAFLIFGLKDWILGDYENGGHFLREFKTSTPPDTEIWLRRYKPISDAYVESFSAFQVATEAAKDAGNSGGKQRALDMIRDAKAKIKNQPGLVAKLTAIEGELAAHVEAATAEMTAQTEAAEAGDKQIINDVKSRVAGYNEKLLFADGHQIVFTATVDGEKAKLELEKWFKRTQWLAKFKSTLVKDLAASGYPKPLTKRDSSVLETGVKSADDAELITPTKTPVLWHDLASDSVIAMAKEFMSKDPAPEAAAERKWLLGAFMYQLGRTADALAMMREAAASNPEYKDGLPLFPEGGWK